MHGQLDSKTVTNGSYFFNIEVSEVLHLFVSMALEEKGRTASEIVQEKYCTPKKSETFEGHHCYHMHLSKNRISFISLNLRNV